MKRKGSKPTAEHSAIAPALLQWYDQTAIQLPWRGERDPYRIWLSEIMLQQTRVTTVESYYRRFVQTFPDIHALAQAPLSQVLKLWEGLGYYSRARNLHKLAQQLVTHQNGIFPTSLESLQALPGIGRYTAAAIASIAFDQPAAVLDGNVIRILTRLFDLADEVELPAVKEKLWKLANSLLPGHRSGAYNQAIMDLGRMICTPRNPSCGSCPIQQHCLAFANGTVALRPVKKPKPAKLRITAVAAILQDQQARFLLLQRPEKGLLGGLWTFPHLKIEANADHTQMLTAFLQTELGLSVHVRTERAVVQQQFTHFHLTLHAYECQLSEGAIIPIAPMPHAWVTFSQLQEYSLGKADREITAGLLTWQPKLF